MVTATEPITEYKALSSVELKADGSGEFTAIISTPAVDAAGDIVLPSAFRAGQDVPLIVGHEWGNLPIGSGKVRPTASDVRLDGRFFTNTDAGKQAYETVKGLGKLAEFSIGFRALDAEYQRQGAEDVRVIKALDLFEVSLVLKGAAVGTGVVSIKSRRGEGSLADMQRWARGERGSPLSPRELSRKGFERVGDFIAYKGVVPLWPASLLESPEFKAERRQLEAIFQPAYRDAWKKWLRQAVRSSAYSDMAPGAFAYATLDGHEQKALSEGSDSAGGYAVPPEVMAEIRARLAATSAIIPHATRLPILRDKLVIGRFKEHASSASIYSSGFVGGWVGEAPATSDTDPSFGTFEIAIKKARATTTLSRDLADDVPELAAALIANGGENLALVQDSAFIAGDGSPAKPLGIINGGSATVDVEGTTANTISNTAGGQGSWPKLINLAYALPSQYAARARWTMRRSVAGHVRGLVDASGRNHWPADASTLFGSPVSESDFMPLDDADGNKPIIFGDLSAYYIAQAPTVSLRVLNERYAEVGQVGINLIDRVGGALFNPDAIRFGVV